MHYVNNTELSSHEETRCQFNGGRCAIKLGIDVHQDFYVVAEQVGGSNPKPPQRFQKEAFLHWAARLKQKSGAQVHAVYEACGFGFALQRQLSALSIQCHVVCPQKLDERNRRVKTDGLDAKALCLKLDRFVQGNRDALAIVRVPSEEEEQLRAIHRQREQLVKARKQLEAQGRSLMVNHDLEPVQNWWKPRTFAALQVSDWIKELLANSQPIPVALQQKIAALTVQLQSAASPDQPRGLGKMTSVVIDREIGDWKRFNTPPHLTPYIGVRRLFSRSLLPRIAGRVDIGDRPRAFGVHLDDRLFSREAKHPTASREDRHAANRHIFERGLVKLFALAHRECPRNNSHPFIRRVRVRCDRTAGGKLDSESDGFGFLYVAIQNAYLHSRGQSRTV